MVGHQAEKRLFLYARMAGLLYLVIIVCGIFSEAVVRSGLIVAGSPAATAANILASPGLFRTGFAADALMLLSDVAVAVLFYVLLRPVDNMLALMAAAFRLVQAAILGTNLLNYNTALFVLESEGPTALFEVDERNTLATLFLEMHSHGYDIGLLFFGISSFILGYLVVRSGYLPRQLGYGLQAAAVVYAAGSFTRFLFPDYISLLEPLYIIPLLAELSFCLWLLAKGIRTDRVPPPVPGEMC